MNQPTFAPGILPPGVIGSAPLPPPRPDGPLVTLAKALEQFPSSLFAFLVGMLVASITDPVSLALTIACVLLGLATGAWLIAASVFFFAYVVVRTVNNVAAAIGGSGRSIAERLTAQDHSATQD